MASWIVHLRIAELLLPRLPGLDACQFAIGNIAPDSGIPDENWEHFDPPPEVTHYKRAHLPVPVGSLAFFRQYLAPLRPADPDPLRFAFRLGYFFHLIADGAWVMEVGRPTHEKYAQQFKANPDFIWEVKKDWYGLDFNYVHSHPKSLFWTVFMGCRSERNDVDFLPPGALQRNIEYIQNYYTHLDDDSRERMARPFVYLSQQQVDDFVTRTAQRCLDEYQRYWLDGLDPAGRHSVFDTAGLP